MPLRPRQNTVLVAALFSAALSFQTVPVQAQGLFETLRGLFGRGFALENEKPEGPYQAYCVRLCDGRFFPLPASDARDRDRGDRERGYSRSRGFFFREYSEEKRPGALTTGQASPDSLCKAMCPATPVRVFSGTLIDNAVSADGMPYSKLQNAFVYREKMISECTCNGVENAGITNLDPESDPTLQPGDIIVTPEGPKVFRGRSGQASPASFVPVKEYRGMSERERKNLSEMRITRAQEPVSAREGIAPSPRLPGIPGITVTPAEDIMNRGFVP